MRLLDAHAFQLALVSASRSSLAEWPRALVVLELDLDALTRERAAAVLRQIDALVLARAPIVEGDELGRLTEARFALFLEATNLDLARSVAESLRGVIADWPFFDDDEPTGVTASFGVVALEKAKGTSLPEGLAAATDCLNAARREGRDRVIARLA